MKIGWGDRTLVSLTWIDRADMKRVFTLFAFGWCWQIILKLEIDRWKSR